MLFNILFGYGCLFFEWKLVDVILIYKKDFKELVENYRLIFFFFIIGKIIECCVVKRFYDYLIDFIFFL